MYASSSCDLKNFLLTTQVVLWRHRSSYDSTNELHRLPTYVVHWHLSASVRTRSIEEEYTSPSKLILSEFTAGSNPDSLWYVMLRAVQLFRSAHGRLPGISDDDLEMDVGRLKVRPVWSVVVRGAVWGASWESIAYLLSYWLYPWTLEGGARGPRFSLEHEPEGGNDRYSSLATQSGYGTYHRKSVRHKLFL